MWLFLAMLAAIAGALIALLLGSALAGGLVGWILSGPIAILLLAAFSIKDTKLRTRVTYVTTSAASVLYWLALVVIALAVVASALMIALWVGRA